MRLLKATLASLLVIWLGFLGAVYLLMRQPPERFASAIARLPGPALMLFPFETLWSRARAGELHVGDEAPDFRLSTLDKTSQISLASFRGSKAVVLVFGSYT
jgi:hypothetical protein